MHLTRHERITQLRLTHKGRTTAKAKLLVRVILPPMELIARGGTAWRLLLWVARFI